MHVQQVEHAIGCWGQTTIGSSVHHPAEGMQRLSHRLLVVEHCTAPALYERSGSLHVLCDRAHQNRQLIGVWLLQSCQMLQCSDQLHIADTAHLALM